MAAPVPFNYGSSVTTGQVYATRDLVADRPERKSRPVKKSRKKRTYQRRDLVAKP